MLKKLNSDNFRNEILDRSGVALVDFYADWCGPCQILSPVIDDIAKERADIAVGKVNVDDEGELALEYGVMSIPSLIIFENGKEKARLVGVRPKEEILAELK